MILEDPIMDEGSDNQIEGPQKMHVRTESWYNERFMSCRFSVKMKKTFSYGDDIYPVMIFCLFLILKTHYLLSSLQANKPQLCAKNATKKTKENNVIEDGMSGNYFKSMKKKY